MTIDGVLRSQLVRLLDWEDAHTGYATAIAVLRGVQPPGLPDSI
jgi:hypothetical protein